MIIFTVTSNITGQVYVGSTRNDLESQWEKMVAAAQQDLDYPLYREIRVNGDTAFTVEEWDRAEDRQELQELEQEAIDHFNAKSLRGYKTSTVKILPKKKTRQKKSSIDKELKAIFLSDDNSKEMAPSLRIKSSDSSALMATAQPVINTPTEKPVADKPVVTKESIKAALAKIAEEEKAKEAAEAAAKEAERLTPPNTGSQANAVVQMNSIAMSNDISAQLAAITAAADAVLSGDSQAVAQLDTIREDAKEAPVLTTQAVQQEEQPRIDDQESVAVTICPKQLRICEAIERQRSLRAKRTSDIIEQERSQLAQQLAELDARAQSLHTNVLAAVA